MLRTLDAAGETGSLAGVLVRPRRLAEARAAAAGRFPVVSDIEALLGLSPDVVVECAGHEAMRQFACRVLAHGTDLVCAAVGVLADEAFTKRISEAGNQTAKIWIPSGAVAGIDGLLAARSAGLKSVAYTSVKAPASWRGTPAEPLISDMKTTFFEGSAREAALQYPQNANVGATVALAGLGLDRTRVRLVSDPGVAGPVGIIQAEGDFGRFTFEILAYASPRNPKTSLLTAHSLLAAARGEARFAPALS
jgi:aspartate dehydrogenase